ncbi:hypothetical protein AAFC00_000879 [Neodothiora populina]|uniref:General transcription and DNA repair factor IIH subunit TFB5 n=1 Tax=Neodothiora populina TaxID=2781224 RepID=A0ABR3PM30_9PEZI
MPKAVTGILVQCDASIKAIICKIDEENGNVFIHEDIDDETLLVHSKKLEELKQRLKDTLKDTVREAEESESE